MTAYQLLGYPLIALGIFQLILTVICLSRAHANRAALLCAPVTGTSAIYSLSAGAVYLLAHEGLDYGFAYRNCWIGWVTVPAIMQLLFYLTGRERLNKYVTYPIYAFWIGVWILTLTTNYVDIPPASLLPYQEIEAPFEKILRGLAMLTLVGLMVWLFTFLRRITGSRRSKLQYVMLGMIMNAVAAIITSAVVQIWTTLPLDPALTSYFGVLLSGPLFYSMTRHRLFDIRFILSRLAVAVFSTAVFGFLHYLILATFMVVVPFKVAVILATLIIGTVLFISPVIEYIRNFSLRIFTRGKDTAALLRDLSNVVVSTTNPDDLFRRFGELLRNALKVKSICFYSAEDDDFKLKHCSGVEPTYFDSDLRFLTGGALSKILVDHREIFVKDEHISENLGGEKEDNGGLETELDAFAMDEVLVPLAARGSVIGIMALGPKINLSGFSSDELAVLGSAGGQMGLALENAKLFEQAVGDGLTGLFHQKYFKARLESELTRARRHNGRFAVLLVDADHFKSINDSLGHVVGDAVLQDLAGLMKTTFRAEDVLARYGGEEFGVILIEADPEKVFAVAERFRLAVEKFNFHETLRVTVSIGVYVFDAQAHGPTLHTSDLLVRADQALYRAKRQGRNRICVFADEADSAVIPDSGT
jgi:diguanylate cyclase (GGDEF)-like protein